MSKIVPADGAFYLSVDVSDYTHDSVAAQSRRAEINGVDRIWYAGAYWGWGFHEDGLRSAVDVAAALGVRWN